MPLSAVDPDWWMTGLRVVKGGKCVLIVCIRVERRVFERESIATLNPAKCIVLFSRRHTQKSRRSSILRHTTSSSYAYGVSFAWFSLCMHGTSQCSSLSMSIYSSASSSAIKVRVARVSTRQFEKCISSARRPGNVLRVPLSSLANRSNRDHLDSERIGNP